MKRHLCGSAFAFVVIAIVSGQAYAQLPTLVRTINGPSPPTDSNFSFSFGNFNGNLLVGAPDFNGPGVAYLMDINTGAIKYVVSVPFQIGHAACIRRRLAKPLLILHARQR